MYYQLFAQLIQALKILERFVEKAEQYADAKKFDVNGLMATSLAPDMRPFSHQVTSACNYAKQAAAWLLGLPLPKHEGSARTIDEIRARLKRTVEFAMQITPDRLENAARRTASYSWKADYVRTGETFVLQMAMPNVFFHCAMAYAILRSRGVDVETMDYPESLRVVPA